MFNPINKTLMQNILDLELRNFHESNKIEVFPGDSSDDFKNGNILFKIPIKKKFMDDMILEHRNPIDINIAKQLEQSKLFHDSRDDSGLFNNVTDKLISVESNSTFIESIDIILSYKNALGRNFYGAILTSGSKIKLNPFHILTALSVMNDDAYLEKKYNIIIYPYSDREALEEYMGKDISDFNKIDNNINTLMNAYVSKIPTIKRIKKTGSTGSMSTSISVTEETKKMHDEDLENDHYLVASQLLTKGIMAPFYGTSLIKLSNYSSKGMRLSPFGCCNIGSDSSNSIRSKPEYKSVCTGDKKNTTLDGLRTLSHANLSSPYGGGYIQNSALNYADVMIEKCISLYEAAKIIEEGKNIPIEFTYPPEPKEDTFSAEELACETLYKYLILCRSGGGYPIKISDISSRYEKMKQFRIESDLADTEESSAAEEPIEEPTEVEDVTEEPIIEPIAEPEDTGDELTDAIRYTMSGSLDYIRDTVPSHVVVADTPVLASDYQPQPEEESEF